MALTHADALLKATAKAAFWQNFEAFPSIMDNIAFRTTSDSDQETYPWLAYAPGVREMTGERKRRSVPELSWVIKNKLWENTVVIDYLTRRAAKLNTVQALLGNLGAKARAYPNSLVSTLMNNGGSTTCYDGQYFFDTDHTDPGAAYQTNQSNALTLDITTVTNPTDIEFATGIRNMRAALYGFKDGDGDPVMPAKGAVMELHVPPMYQAIAERVEKVDQLTGPVGNDLKGTFTTVINPWLTTPTSSHGYIYLFNVTGVRKPFIYQVLDEVRLEDDMGSQNDFDTKDVAFGSFAAYNANYGDWRYACRQDFT